jgi:CheY-like chemotaxis protein
VPILAFTADSAASADCGAQGFDGVIAKPISPATLVAAIIQATRWQWQDEVVEADRVPGR